MSKAIDITNQVFNKLTVIERNGSIGNRAAWKCKCECGKIITLTGTDLRRGRKKSCGCELEKQKNALKNQKFGHLTALFPTEKRSIDGCVMWHCKCDCGKEIDVKSGSLKSGNTSSCGCIRIKKIIKQNHSKAIDLTNQTFGKLTALYPTDKRLDRSVIWHCKCKCGNECDVSQRDLVSKNTKSCGCMRNKSYGEFKIANLLKQNNISYIKEYTPKNCNLTFKPRFDFYLPDYNCLIEYDGIQHFIEGTGNYDNKEKFKITKQHDEEKNQFCLDNNIFLIRIPYTHYDNIILEDLIPNSSSFLHF